MLQRSVRVRLSVHVRRRSEETEALVKWSKSARACCGRLKCFYEVSLAWKSRKTAPGKSFCDPWCQRSSTEDGASNAKDHVRWLGQPAIAHRCYILLS